MQRLHLPSRRSYFRSKETFNVGFFDKASRNWETAWQLNLTPWDLKGGVTPPLKEIFDKPPNFEISYLSKRRALVPGCGSGYDCAFLAELGFQSVTGLDISSTAIQIAQENTKSLNLSHLQFEVADFFHYQPSEPFDFIFDYLFFAALDPPCRLSWAKSMTQLLRPSTGLLVTLIFPLKQLKDDANTGPPYPVLLTDYQQYLQQIDQRWSLLNIQEPKTSIKPRKDRELLAYWALKE
jgi:methyl halide transferase